MVDIESPLRAAPGRAPTRMVGELVRRRRDFLEQGEVFSTIGLAWVLRLVGARAAFGELFDVDDAVEWSADVPIPGVGRVDLLGQADRGDSGPPSVVEVKIHHDLDLAQLEAYGRWLVDAFAHIDERVPLLGLLVPHSRRHEAATLANQLGEVVPVRTPVVTWEAVFEALDLALTGDARADFDQLLDLYQQYDADWVQPLRLKETADEWELRRDDYKRLANELTLELQRVVAGFIGLDRTRAWPLRPEGYRYVQMRPEPEATSLAIGLFPSLQGVPFAIRYHRDTSDFDGVLARLGGAGVPIERDAAAHLYVRIAVPAEMSKREMLADLDRQIRRVVVVAHPELSALLLAEV